MPDSLQTKLTSAQITAMCQRGFGGEVTIESVQELGGGTFNETYLIELAGKPKVILRVAPPLRADTYWDDVALMRREHNILPFFASIATLMPKTIMADFTHQVVQRDYILQTYIEGERWSDIEDELTPDENLELWRQCGKIVKQMHETTGERFGYPQPGHQSTSWSEIVLDRFTGLPRACWLINLRQRHSGLFQIVRVPTPPYLTKSILRTCSIMTSGPLI